MSSKCRLWNLNPTGLEPKISWLSLLPSQSNALVQGLLRRMTLKMELTSSHRKRLIHTNSRNPENANLFSRPWNLQKTLLASSAALILILFCEGCGPIFLQSFSLARLPGLSIFGHSIWHIFWYLIWHFIWRSIWHLTWHSFRLWSGILSDRYSGSLFHSHTYFYLASWHISWHHVPSRIHGPRGLGIRELLALVRSGHKTWWLHAKNISDP